MKVELVSVLASDDMVVRAAQVSTKGADSTAAKNAGLIRYLIRENHMSPFEHNSFTFLVHAPIFVTREMLRHRAGTSFNEESGRYRELETTFYYPDAQRPLKQVGRTGDYVFEMGNELREPALGLFDSAYGLAEEAYRQLLELGVAKEVARMVLPVGVYSSIYFTVNARSLMHFLDLRTAHNAQWEIRWVAESMIPHFEEHMPITCQAWKDRNEY